MDGAKLILGDTIRTPEIVGLSALGNVVIGGVAKIPENAVDFFLRELTVHSLLSAGFAVSLPWPQPLP